MRKNLVIASIALLALIAGIFVRERFDMARPPFPRNSYGDKMNFIKKESIFPMPTKYYVLEDGISDCRYNGECKNFGYASIMLWNRNGINKVAIAQVHSGRLPYTGNSHSGVSASSKLYHGCPRYLEFTVVNPEKKDKLRVTVTDRLGNITESVHVISENIYYPTLFPGVISY